MSDLEHVVLQIIRHGRARCGAGFGNYAHGLRDALSILLPLVPTSEPVKAELADFDEKLAG